VWLAALHTLTSGIGGGTIGQEALKAFAVASATWLLLHPAAGGGEEREKGGGGKLLPKKAHSLPIDAEGRVGVESGGGETTTTAQRKTTKNKGKTGGGLGLFSSSSYSFAPRSLLRLRKDQSVSSSVGSAATTTIITTSSMSSSSIIGPLSPHRQATYTMVAPPVDWAALLLRRGKKGKRYIERVCVLCICVWVSSNRSIHIHPPSLPSPFT
jgi:hypothetical protein